MQICKACECDGLAFDNVIHKYFYLPGKEIRCYPNVLLIVHKIMLTQQVATYVCVQLIWS